MSLPQDTINLTRLFIVTIDSLEAAVFTECEGLQVQLDVQEYQEGGENTYAHKLVGPARWSNIVLRRGTTADKAFFDWVNQTIQASLSGGKVERKTGSIIALARDHKTHVTEWRFRDAWPCRYRGPDFSTIQRVENAIEELELAHNGFEQVS